MVPDPLRTMAPMVIRQGPGGTRMPTCHVVIGDQDVRVVPVSPEGGITSSDRRVQCDRSGKHDEPEEYERCQSSDVRHDMSAVVLRAGDEAVTTTDGAAPHDTLELYLACAESRTNAQAQPRRPLQTEPTDQRADSGVQDAAEIVSSTPGSREVIE